MAHSALSVWKRRGAVAALLTALLTAPLAAAGIEVTADRTEITIQEQIVLTVTVEGSSRARPELPPLPEFAVHERGQSSQVSILNGRASSSVAYRYLLVPTATGDFDIGSARVEIDGETYASRPFRVRVLDAEAQPRAERDLFVSARVSTTTPYVGQQVVYIWRLYRRVRIGDARLEPQEFDGFLVEDLGEVREYPASVEGRQFLVSEIRKSLFPQEVGPLRVPGSQLTCQVAGSDQGRRRSLFDDFFGAPATETRILRSAPIELEVRSLPPPPPGFSGLVGSFRLEAGISKQELKVGESTTLRLTVSGTGNPQMIVPPALPDLAPFKVYDDQPSSTLDRSGRALSGSKSFRKALVPLEPGELVIPALELVYFDPEAETFQTSRTAEIALTVHPALGEEELRLTESVGPSTGKVAVKILADDILPIHKGLDAVAARPLATRPALVASGLLAPPVLYLGLALFARRRRELELDADLRRRRSAWRNARRRLQRLESDAGGDAAEAARRASRCLREFIGDKLGLEGSALTPAEVERELRRQGLEESLVEEIWRLLERLEAAQFGAARLESERLGGQIRELLRRLERGLPK